MTNDEETALAQNLPARPRPCSGSSGLTFLAHTLRLSLDAVGFFACVGEQMAGGSVTAVQPQ